MFSVIFQRLDVKAAQNVENAPAWLVAAFALIN